MTVLQTSSVTSLVPTHLKFPCGAFVTLIKTTRGLFHQLPPPAAVYLFSPFVCNESDHSYGFISRSPSFYLLFCIWYLPPAVCLSSTVRNVNSGLIIMPRSCPCVSEQRCKLGDDTATGRLATSCFVSLSGCLLLQQNGKCVMWLFLCVDTGAAAMTLITELLVLIINYVHHMILDLDHLTSTLNVSATRMQQSASAEITVCLMDLFMVIRGSHVVEKSLDWQPLWLISGLCLHLYLNDTPLKFYDCISLLYWQKYVHRQTDSTSSIRVNRIDWSWDQMIPASCVLSLVTFKMIFILGDHRCFCPVWKPKRYGPKPHWVSFIRSI